MVSLKRFTGGVLFGWGATLASIVIGVFMSPFLIHHLGETGYGVWVLVQSSVSYMYIMDLGLRSTVLRFSVQAHARGDHAEVNRVVSAALWIRVMTAAAIMAIACLMVVFLPRLFHIPAEYQHTAQITILLAAATLSSTLVFSIYAAVLSSLGRFDLLGMFELLQTLATSIGLVPILLLGRSLISMALWQFTVVMTINLIIAATCYRQYPTLKLTLGMPQKELLRSLWNFSFYVLLLNAAGQMILYADNLVVGAFITAAAVSYYAVAAKMVEYLRQVAIAILKNFMPMASAYAAGNDQRKLQQLHLHGTQAVLLVTYPVAAVLLTRGHTVFRIWISGHFADQAYPILQVLVIAAAAMLANSSANGLALAIGKQRPLAWITVAEGITNLTLSIVLARHYGVIGVALGTALPTTITSLFFWPHYLCRELRISSLTFVLQAWLRPIAAVLPFALGCFWAESHWNTPSLRVLTMQMIALLPLLALGLGIVFLRELPLAYGYLRDRRSQAAAA